MRLINADDIQYDQLLNIGYKEHPLEWAASRSLIDSMPTIDAEPVRHGYWIRTGKERPGAPESIRCSECGFWYIKLTPRFYCSNCGAKMDKRRKDG